MINETAAKALTNSRLPPARPEDQRNHKEYAQRAEDDVRYIAQASGRRERVRETDARDAALWVDAYGRGGWVGRKVREG